MSFRQQAREEESTLRRDLNRALVADIPADPAETRAVLAKLRAKADNVLHLRRQAWSEEAYAAAERRATLRERIQEEQEKAEERKRREPGRRATKLVLSFAHPELRGLALNSSLLSVEEGVELLGLVEERCEGGLPARKERRYQRLVGVLCGDPEVFERAREERERQEAEEARARLDRGPVELPTFLADWLFDPRPDTLSAGDLAVLSAILFGLERNESPFTGATVRGDVIVLDDGQAPQLLPRMSGGTGSVRDSLRYLADLDLIELGVSEEGRTAIGRGDQLSRGQLAEPVT